MLGHEVNLLDAKGKAGGLNEFGIAAYKSTDDFAAKEVEWLMGIGGISFHKGQVLGESFQLDELVANHDAVFLGVGLGGVNALGVPGDDQESVFDAVRFIAHLRQSADLTQLPVGRNVVVIGGGMTAIDAAVQSKLLGAMNVTLAYRRGRDAMGASQYEQDLAASKGVKLMFNVQPKALIGDEENFVEFIELEYTEDDGSGLKGTGETVRLETDQVFRAIGQTLTTDGGLALDGRKIAVSETGKTSNDKVWAGGDCAAGGDDLTVTAGAEGRDAAMDIHATLMGGAA
jgi:glutamate synthase (NADPH/NADH) small chain